MNRQAAPSAITVHPIVTEALKYGRYPAMADAISLRTNNLDLASALFQKQTIVLHENTMQIVQRHGFPIIPIGAAPVGYGTRLFHGIDSDWALVPLSEDPLFLETNRKFPLPNAIKHQLSLYHKKGLRFEHIFVGHEIEQGALQPGQALTLDLIKPPPAPKVSQRLEKLGTTAQSAWQVLGRTASDAARVVAWAAVLGLALPLAPVAAIGASATFIGSAITYDPILFGLHIDRSVNIGGRPLAIWYYLTHWEW